MARQIVPLREMRPLGLSAEPAAVTSNFLELMDWATEMVAYSNLTLGEQRALASAAGGTSFQTGLTAATASNQLGATQLNVGFNQASVCATAGDSFKLPTAVARLKVTLRNDGAESSDVFPKDGDSAQINGASVDAAIAIAAGATADFFCQSSTQWWSDT